DGNGTFDLRKVNLKILTQYVALQFEPKCIIWHRRHFLQRLLLALGCPFLDASPGAAQVSKEYVVKAVFLFRFAQFVKWPLQAFPTAQSPIVFGVLGENPFGNALELAVRGESVNGRSLKVKEFKDVKETGDCQVLFISRSETAHLPGIFDALKGRSV